MQLWDILAISKTWESCNYENIKLIEIFTIVMYEVAFVRNTVAIVRDSGNFKKEMTLMRSPN